MLTWLYLKAVQRMEARYGYDAAYLRDLAEASPTAFRRFARAQMALRHRAAPLPAWFGAQLAATLHEDCGPCVQIVALRTTTAAGCAGRPLRPNSPAG